MGKKGGLKVMDIFCIWHEYKYNRYGTGILCDFFIFTLEQFIVLNNSQNMSEHYRTCVK